MGTFPEPFKAFQCTVDVPEVQVGIDVQFLFSFGGAGSWIRNPLLGTAAFGGICQKSDQPQPPKYLYIKLLNLQASGWIEIAAGKVCPKAYSHPGKAFQRILTYFGPDPG